jgi:fibronectin type 3 domain-containing protein
MPRDGVTGMEAVCRGQLSTRVDGGGELISGFTLNDPPARRFRPARLLGLAACALSVAAAILSPIGDTVAAVNLASGPRTAAAAASPGDPVIATAGDIACVPGRTPTVSSCQHAKTGDVLAAIQPTVVLPLGDEQYMSGAPAEYAGSYDKVRWGANKSISRPAVGNHEYRTAGASGYYGYFGSNAGDPARGYYSYDVTGPNGAFRWHLISLNSECAQIGGCGVGSAQEVWLKNDLAAHSGVCTMAYWHRPRFSSGSTVPSSTTYVPFWNDLYNAGADLVLNGHAHHYERFAPQTASGAADPAKGVTELVVGTGGEDFQQIGSIVANSVVRNNSTFGVLKVTLHASGYDWQFIPAAGYTFTDSGSAACHSAPAVDATPPSQPAALSASSTTPSQAKLTWTPSIDNVGVKSYNIFRGTNGSTPARFAATTSNATAYTDSAVAASTSYTYQVQAVDAAGNVSQLSAPASVTLPGTTDTAPPTPPGSLHADVVSSGEVDLGWTASTDTGTGVKGYRVYRAPAGSGGYTLLDTTSGTGVSYQDLTPKPSTSYDYQAVAFDGAGNTSGISNTVTVTTPAAPPTQTFTFAAAGDATIDKSNAAGALGTDTKLVADGGPVDDFLLKFKVATSGCSSLTSATLRLTDKADGSVKGGDLYSTGSGWNESTVTWSSAPARGVLINSLGAVVSGGTYEVDVTKGVTVLNGEADFRISSTVSDGAHYYSLEGAAGNGSRQPQLTVVCATTGSGGAGPADTNAPTAPTNLVATAPGASQVDLGWTAATDNIAVTGYRIYRDGVQIGSVPATALTYRDTTVAASTTFAYATTAVDAAGNESVRSNTATAVTPAAPPPRTFTFSAAADATLDQANASTNYGADTKLVVDGAPVDDFLLRFDVSTTGCSSVVEATLRLADKADGSVKGGDFYGTASGWSETTVNWSNAPSRGTLISSPGAVASGSTYTVDVTAGVAAPNGEIDFRVASSSSDGAHYYSKEGAAGNAGLVPQLTVTCS